MSQRDRFGAAGAALVVLVAGCAVPGCAADSEDSADIRKPGSTNVSQGGAQDFAEFRAIVDEGGVPAPGLLDPVGFFAEHAVDLPPADCGQDLCVHSMLAVAPRFDGSNWTMAFVAMNTPLQPEDLERPPLHLVVALEATGWMTTMQASLQKGLEGIVEQLRPEDRLSLVAYGAHAETVLAASPPDAAAAVAALAKVSPGEPVDLYAGLAAAQRALDATPGLEARRVLLVGTGAANTGIVDPERVVGLGEAMARSGTALGVVGVTPEYDAAIPAAIGSLGAGSYSYAIDGAELERVLRLEGETTLFPLATDLRLELTPAEGYRVGRLYGVPRLAADADGATLDLPALFIGQRSGAQDVGGGRRGGGAGIFIELRADPDTDVGAGAAAYEMGAQWKTSAGDEATQATTVTNELAPGDNPETMWPSFSHPDLGKPFMMLNMYLALKTAVELYAEGDCARAMGVFDMMQVSVNGWQGKFDDPDIDADNEVLFKLGQNITAECQKKGTVTPKRPEAADSGCMML
jgi:Ca-activated chloride channel family protein